MKKQINFHLLLRKRKISKIKSINFLNLCLVGVLLLVSVGCREFTKGFKEGYDRAWGGSNVSTSRSSNDYNTNSAGINTDSRKSDIYDKPTLPPDRNGFSRDKVTELSISGYPNASGALIANYKITSSRNSIVIEAALYPSEDIAKDSFENNLNSAGAKILEKNSVNGSPYAYYKNTIGGNTYYHFCLQYKNQLMDYFAANLETVKEFLK